MKCPSCGATIESDDRFCPECGTQIVNQTQMQEENYEAFQVRCPKCNELNEAGTRFCCYCGYDFNKMHVTHEMPVSRKKSSSKMILGVAGLVLLAVVGGVATHFISGNKKNVEKADQATTTAATESAAVATTQAATTETPVTEATTQQEVPALQMKYTDNSSCDIDRNMTSDAFAYVESEDGSYSFSYPKYLFNNFSYSEEDGYYFSYEDNGNTICSLRYYAVDDPGNPIDRGIAVQSKLIGEVYDTGFVFPSNVREKGPGDDGIMQVIVLGWPDSSYSKARYVCAGNDGQKTYYMEFNYPDADKNDTTEKWDYIYDSTYRACTFCGSSKSPYSTYQSFKEAMQE